MQSTAPVRDRGPLSGGPVDRGWRVHDSHRRSSGRDAGSRSAQAGDDAAGSLIGGGWGSAAQDASAVDHNPSGGWGGWGSASRDTSPAKDSGKGGGWGAQDGAAEDSTTRDAAAGWGASTSADARSSSAAWGAWGAGAASQETTIASSGGWGAWGDEATSQEMATASSGGWGAGGDEATSQEMATASSDGWGAWGGKTNAPHDAGGASASGWAAWDDSHLGDGGLPTVADADLCEIEPIRSPVKSWGNPDVHDTALTRRPGIAGSATSRRSGAVAYAPVVDDPSLGDGNADAGGWGAWDSPSKAAAMPADNLGWTVLHPEGMSTILAYSRVTRHSHSSS
jgi:hypothetical protein